MKRIRVDVNVDLDDLESEIEEHFCKSNCIMGHIDKEGQISVLERIKTYVAELDKDLFVYLSQPPREITQVCQDLQRIINGG